ncbi:MAG: hypothetical protein ACI8XV_000454 [Arenicella sp.]|jgi:hypothetical protein
MKHRYLLLVLAAAHFACSTTVVAQQFGVDMPSESGDSKFPVSETTINSWVFGDQPDLANVYRHGWGIWAGLQTKTGNSTYFGLDNARVYQTWMSPGGIIDLMEGEKSAPLLLRTPNQFSKGVNTASLFDKSNATKTGIPIDYSIAEVVAYSPTSAKHAFTNKLLYTNVLDTYIKEGYTVIPRFPNTTVNIKPVYKLVTPDETFERDGKTLFAMPAWPGTPDVSNWTAQQKTVGYGPRQWGQCSYIDVNQKGPSRANGIDKSCSSPNANNTYGLGDFIYIKITKEDQVYFKALVGEPGGTLVPGDLLVLVGMHVTSRETERWTWQTFWWSANPDKPLAPSKVDIAKQRPSDLPWDAAHYAMASAYSMLIPAQPLIGGKNVGSLLPAYNPHLEAGFGSGVFGISHAVRTPSGKVTTDLGVESNCMTCHGLAGYLTDNPNYASNFYVPRNDAALSDGIDVDFAWSIAVEAVAEPKSKP